VRGYRDLKVWQKAMDLAEHVYCLSRQLPKEEQYRLTSQILRAVASVPANIAEGRQRGTRKDYAHFIAIARGSLAETETFIMLASRAGLILEAEASAILDQADEVSRMLYSLRQRLSAAPKTPDPWPLTPDL
jgi:four helix bundle protein